MEFDPRTGATELQRRFRERVDGDPVIPLGVGMGLDAGEAVPTEGGYQFHETSRDIAESEDFEEEAQTVVGGLHCGNVATEDTKIDTR